MSNREQDTSSSSIVKISAKPKATTPELRRSARINAAESKKDSVEAPPVTRIIIVAVPTQRTPKTPSRTRQSTAWSPEEDAACVALMRSCLSKLRAHPRTVTEIYQFVAAGMNRQGYPRTWSGVRNQWARRLRAVHPELDERRHKTGVSAAGRRTKKRKAAALKEEGKGKGLMLEDGESDEESIVDDEEAVSDSDLEEEDPVITPSGKGKEKVVEKGAEKGKMSFGKSPLKKGKMMMGEVEAADNEQDKAERTAARARSGAPSCSPTRAKKD